MIYAQSGPKREDSVWVKQLLIELSREKALPLNQLLVKAGQRMLATPYVANTLDKSGEEKLVINLRGLDCTTFIETALALALTVHSADTSFASFSHHLQSIRYRNGLIKGYPSRLHYFSDWLYEGQRQGRFEIITTSLGGKPYQKKIDFMTTHRNLYPALGQDSVWLSMQQVESALNERSYSFLPKASVARIEEQLWEGDIIAITTSIKGLDMVHVGMAVKRQGRTYLLHASQTMHKVVLSDKPLVEYLAGNSTQTGIMVARIKHGEQGIK